MVYGRFVDDWERDGVELCEKTEYWAILPCFWLWLSAISLFIFQRQSYSRFCSQWQLSKVIANWYVEVLLIYHSKIDMLSSSTGLSWTKLKPCAISPVLLIYGGNTQLLSQISFSHISINSSTILTVLMATKSPWIDFLINTSHISKWSILAKILGRSTGNYYSTIY